MNSSEKTEIPLDRVINAQENKKFLQRLVCSICLNILWKPVSCTNCQSHFCEDCITQCVTSTNTCPNRCPYVKANPHHIVLDLLSVLQVMCENKQKGCDENIDYEQLEKHPADCPFRSVECKQCKILIQHNKLGEHEEVCEFIKKPCKTCGEKFFEKELEKHDEVACLRVICKQKDEEIMNLKKRKDEEIVNLKKQKDEEIAIFKKQKEEEVSSWKKQKDNENTFLKNSFDAKIINYFQEIQDLRSKCFAYEEQLANYEQDEDEDEDDDEEEMERHNFVPHNYDTPHHFICERCGHRGTKKKFFCIKCHETG